MRYSLVNATALGFDLVRLAGGVRTAEVLLVACEATPAELSRLAGVHPGPEREARWAEVRERTVLARPALTAADLADPALSGEGAQADLAGAELITRIAEAPLGDLDALAHFVRDQALEASWTRVGEYLIQDFTAQLAGEVLLDAATSAYCSDLLPDDERRRLAGPYLQVRPPAPTPSHPAVAALLADLGAWGPQERQALAQAVDATRSASTRWAQAMHEAGWAAHLSGRTRAAAIAQLHTVGAFRAAGFSTTEGASGAWNALSGVVQAVVVADLLGSEELDLLLLPWVLARGVDPR